jgi:hypothetical protein
MSKRTFFTDILKNSSKFKCNLYTWNRIFMLNADPDSDPTTQIYADPDPKPCPGEASNPPERTSNSSKKEFSNYFGW